FHHAGSAESEDGEVVSGSALAAALPAVHPFAAIGVVVLFPYRRVWLEEIFFLGEEIVGRIEHRTAEPLGREIDQIAEVSHVPIASPMCAPSSHTFRPRTNV